MPNEITDLREQLKNISTELQNTVSMQKIIEIAKQAEELNMAEKNKTHDCETKKPVIAVAKDEAFCFYYEDNLRLLRENGATLVEFSPLHDTDLPENCCGILLGGGYPELYAAKLSENKRMRSAIKTAMENKVPIVAECGGFMYLHSMLSDKEENLYEMSGVLPDKCYYAGKLVRFGYMEIQEVQENFLPEGEVIRGHEFHYWDSENNGADCIATKPGTGKNYSCIHSGKHYWFGFPHLYYPSNPHFAENFVKKAKAYMKREDI